MVKEGTPLPTEGIQPISMKGLITRLEDKNREVDGMLFSTFGKESFIALVFPTPSSRQIQNGKAEVDEFWWLL